MACPALPLCGLAMTEAERILPDVLKRIEKLLLDLKIEKSILFIKFFTELDINFIHSFRIFAH